VSDDAKRLEELRANKERREAERRAEAERLELELLELEEKSEAEGLARGRDFEIIDCREHGEGIVAVKRGLAVVHKKFVNSKQTDTDLDHYVTPNLIAPDAKKYREIVERRPFIAIRCANALATLYGMKKGEDAGKY
jgi:hypothetical protein